MSYFLWIEDFEKSAENSVENTASCVLNSIICQPFESNERELKRQLKGQGIFLELTFEDGLSFIRDKSNLHQIDYIILDIDLKSHDGSSEISSDVLKLLCKFQKHILEEEDESRKEELLAKACDNLKEIAGFYLYTDLVVELGFPKTHILFCSNHGKETISIRNAFEQAKISLPKIHTKSDSKVQEWVKSCYDNPYSRLRRGIIEGCKYLKSLTEEKNFTEEKLRFNSFIQDKNKQITLEDLHNYLDVLENFLPLREPPDKATFYKLFVRTLAHEWESANNWKSLKRELFAFGKIMKMTRNWLAHSHIFENIKEQDVTYLFMVNMRAMFELDDDLMDYERYLLQLFEPISATEIEKKIGSERPLTREIPLERNYATLLKKANKWEAINFDDALNQLQKNLQKSVNSQDDNNYLIKGLYQIFWFLTSSGRVIGTPMKDGSTKLNYNFRYFDYYKNKKNNYLFELARHIYKQSFDD